jgi:hypothetical protein
MVMTLVYSWRVLGARRVFPKLPPPWSRRWPTTSSLTELPNQEFVIVVVLLLLVIIAIITIIFSPILISLLSLRPLQVVTDHPTLMSNTPGLLSVLFTELWLLLRLSSPPHLLLL